MGKFWSLLFLCVTIFGVGAFIAGPAMGVWLPINVSETGRTIDHLFKFILVLTGVVFIATELALFFFLWRYDAKSNTQPAKFTHGSHTLEICWTIVPAATLLFIAIYQMNTWADAKMRAPNAGGHAQNFTVEVTGRQFEWRLRYPRTKPPIGKTGIRWCSARTTCTTSTICTCRSAKEVFVSLKSMDVLHSFFLPNMRVKQDAVPGMKIPVWFRPDARTGPITTSALRRVVRLGTLQDERPVDRRIALRNTNLMLSRTRGPAERHAGRRPAESDEGDFGK